jgi:50S ribosomal subunit-associated GTPase HflX
MIIHPVTDNKNWNRVVWESEEAMELVRATNWDILPGPNEPRRGWDESALAAIDESRASMLLLSPSASNCSWLTVKSEQEEEDAEQDLDDPLWNSPVVRRQFAETSIIRIHGVKADWYLSEGKVEEIAIYIGKSIHPPSYIFFNNTLTPTQHANLQQVFNQALNAWKSRRAREDKETARMKAQVGALPEDEQLAYQDRTDNFIPDFITVIDRPRMILELFASRADSGVPKLQVDVARRLWLKRNINSTNFQYMKRSMDSLHKYVSPFAERITYQGNIDIDATQGNPGESNMARFMKELMKDILKLKKRINVIRAQREKQRLGRRMVSVALVGYTNAGKTAIMNHLADEHFKSRDIVFQTLDTSCRAVRLPSGNSCMLVDSVGFVQNLPQFLFDTFHATLEEILTAQIILHVRDASHPFAEEQKTAVEEALMRAGLTDLHSRVIQVWNKTDKVPGFASPGILVSALERSGFDELLAAIDEKCATLQQSRRVQITAALSESAEIFKYARANCLVFYDDSLTVSDDGEVLQIEALLDANQFDSLGSVIVE